MHMRWPGWRGCSAQSGLSSGPRGGLRTGAKALQGGPDQKMAHPERLEGSGHSHARLVRRTLTSQG
eukprot:8410064-Alexandrium_andersonii.AAC.1